MRVYDQIIFDELTAGRPMLLTEIGYLEVVTKPAEMRSDKSVSAPRKIIVYSAEAPQNARNIVDILAATGVDSQSAWDKYNAWLAESRKDGAVEIEGIGKINKEYKFLPTGEFDRALNPGNEEAVVVKSRGKGWIWILVIVLLLAIFLFLRFCTNTFVSGETETTVQTEVIAPTPAPQPEVVEPVAEPETKATDPVLGLGYPLEGKHYVVGGVFDYPENADKYIAEIKRTYPDLTPEKFAYPGVRPGRTMVTVFSSDNRRESLNIRRQLAWNFGLEDFWLFPEEK